VADITQKQALSVPKATAMPSFSFVKKKGWLFGFCFVFFQIQVGW
jgi:hypothetical protein